MEREFFETQEFERQWARLGLNDDDLAKGNLKLKSFKANFEPIPDYKPEDIKRIRTSSSLTQAGFAVCF